jgi:hypothetical protein
MDLTRAENDVHLFTAAFRAQDMDALSSQFAPDIRLHSPLLTTPFEGYDAAVELYEVLFTALKDVEVVFTARNRNIEAFHWRGTAGGRRIEGVDLLTFNAEGKIAEIRVTIRTLPALAAFALAAGPPLARRRGLIRGLVAYALTYPLKPLFAAVDAIEPRLTQRPR